MKKNGGKILSLSLAAGLVLCGGALAGCSSEPSGSGGCDGGAEGFGVSGRHIDFDFEKHRFPRLKNETCGI